MRAGKSNGAISVHAIAGTYVVTLGLDATVDAARNLLGYAIQRKDHATGKRIWLKNARSFEGKGISAVGGFDDSVNAPVQAFLWGDYVVSPGNTYTYTVYPVYGAPGRMRKGYSVKIAVRTEHEDDGKHAVFFNRGVAGSQSYSRQFQRYQRWYMFDRYGRTAWRSFIRPDNVPGQRAWKWLSRGLEEALLKYVGQARGKKYALRAAVYEFEYVPVIQAFIDALESGADVKIIYDAKGKERGKEGPWRETEEALGRVGLRKRASINAFANMMLMRTKATISHNKFIVLLQDGVATQVWTGSANITEGGLFGQSNVGHIIRDEKVAAKYLEYWNKLATDPVKKKESQEPEEMGLRNWNNARQPDLRNAPPENTIIPIFSPRLTDEMLEWYSKRVSQAQQSVYFTAAFGVCEQIAQKLVRKRRAGTAEPYLRYIMLENRPSLAQSRKRKENAKQRGRKAPRDYYDFIKVSSNRIAVGAAYSGSRSKKLKRRLLEESLSGLDTHVEFLHTKYMLVDPLSDDPIVITGSANFSGNSVLNNDENMLIIRGNTRVADIFFTEFMRLFNHFYTRNQWNSMTDEELNDSRYLCSDGSWTKEYYQPGTQKYSERLLYRYHGE